jgi:HPr kinase/phosphorylase
MVERPARLETSGMLQQFEFQSDGKAEAQVRGGKPQERRVSDESLDADSGSGYVLLADHGGASLPDRAGPVCVVMQTHGSCASRTGDGVLLIGPPGVGKSDLLLRLLARGFDLVADDRVYIDEGIARPPPGLAGLLEVRGLGIVRLPHVAEARLALVVELGSRATRLPAPTRHYTFDLPLVLVDPNAASAPERVALALDCALGRIAQVAGAFAA